MLNFMKMLIFMDFMVLDPPNQGGGQPGPMDPYGSLDPNEFQ